MALNLISLMWIKGLTYSWITEISKLTTIISVVILAY